MNHLTTIAAIPGSGAGCAAAMKLEEQPARKSVTVTVTVANKASLDINVFRRYLQRMQRGGL